MNQKDIAELKRRLNPDKRYPTVLRGLYADASGQVISAFAQPVYHLPQEENEKYMSLFKKVLSGTQGQNLLPVDFSAAQVMESAQHRMLSDMRSSGLTDEEAVNAFFESALRFISDTGSAQAQSIAENQAACNYLVLLLHDGYDIAYRDANGETDSEQSTDVFSYILGCICPVKQTKPTLSYFVEDSFFHARLSDWAVGNPELGFLFPAYEERSANIYRALFYTRDASKTHESFFEHVFGMEERPMPAKEQTEVFQTVLQDSLAEECCLDVMQAVHESVRAMIEEQKADKTAEPLTLTKQDVKQVLEGCGVSEEKASAFEERYDSTFGAYAELPAVNLVRPKEFKVDTPSVSIRVDPDRSDLIETRVIDGKCYILVLADGDVQVNGVNVKF